MAKLTNYDGPSNEILAVADNYVNITSTADKTTHAALVTQIDGRDIIKAGNLFPSNDASAVGVVFHDVDVTDGPQVFPLLIKGFLNTAKLPVIPASAAKSALKDVQFLPIETITPELTAEQAEVAVGTDAGQFVGAVTLSTASFRDVATDLANWTISAGLTNMAAVSVMLSGDKLTAYITFEPSAAAVAGTVTAVPKAAAISTGVAPTTAVVVVTVA